MNRVEIEGGKKERLGGAKEGNGEGGVQILDVERSWKGEDETLSPSVSNTLLYCL